MGSMLCLARWWKAWRLSERWRKWGLSPDRQVGQWSLQTAEKHSTLYTCAVVTATQHCMLCWFLWRCICCYDILVYGLHVCYIHIASMCLTIVVSQTYGTAQQSGCVIELKGTYVYVCVLLILGVYNTLMIRKMCIYIRTYSSCQPLLVISCAWGWKISRIDTVPVKQNVITGIQCAANTLPAPLHVRRQGGG